MKYIGRKVTLNKPRRISKGEPSYGKKKSVVYVMDKGKVKKYFLESNMKIKRINQNAGAFRSRHNVMIMDQKQAR